eukprot:CAMPEP_0119309576 /NCGR_PEP_ID=MMETSP1333-20130426/15843_1 /TAXON_ID=418940 /ORGANISM="Scyphosphaera apsteinii, Strain RCC1455" /LENGTH=136 /DNA_ID=CAMNT_0007313569 /DNA_START=554 /DNA_END=965 /DNA_ORIENTATION=-
MADLAVCGVTGFAACGVADFAACGVAAAGEVAAAFGAADSDGVLTRLGRFTVEFVALLGQVECWHFQLLEAHRHQLASPPWLTTSALELLRAFWPQQAVVAVGLLLHRTAQLLVETARHQDAAFYLLAWIVQGAAA